MPNQNKPCCLFFFHKFFLVNSSQTELIAPLAIIEADIRRFHSQGVSIPKMVCLLKKHYDTAIYGIGWVILSFISLLMHLMIKCSGRRS